MQSPYVYTVYESFFTGPTSTQSIALLFVAGSTASAIASATVAPLADLFGRKRVCLFYTLAYGLCALSVSFNVLPVLISGRVLGGIAVMILYSAFDAWMATEHINSPAKYEPEWLDDTYAKMAGLNSATAIIASLASWAVASIWGVTAPFYLAILSLVGTAIMITSFWTENYGTENEPASLAIASMDGGDAAVVEKAVAGIKGSLILVWDSIKTLFNQPEVSLCMGTFNQRPLFTISP
jgi:MFS transporter, MFS domain-containing protein family, molybdate-anion transporter